MKNLKVKNINWKFVYKAIFFVFIFGLIFALFFISPGSGLDWWTFINPAVHDTFSGLNPYNESIRNPIWALILLSPFSLFHPKVGGALISTISYISFAFVALQMKAKPITFALLMLSPPVLFSAYIGNIDFLVALGLLMPPQIGLFFILIKPQVSIGVAIFWLIKCFNQGGIRKVFVTFFPVTLALLTSFIIYGFYLLKPSNKMIIGWWNWSVWPEMLIVGLLLMVAAIRLKIFDLSVLASPFFSPYVGFYSLSVNLMVLSNSSLNTALAVSYFYFYDLLTYQKMLMIIRDLIYGISMIN